LVLWWYASEENMGVEEIISAAATSIAMIDPLLGRVQ